MNAGTVHGTGNGRSDTSRGGSVVARVRAVRAEARATIRQTKAGRAWYDGLSLFAYVATAFFLIGLIGWLVTGCANTTNTKPERATYIVSPEDCALESVACGLDVWPECGPLPDGNTTPAEAMEYGFCKIQSALKCYAALTGPGGACERVVVGD